MRNSSLDSFGNRKLEENDVFQHNAWDQVEWGEEQEQAAKDKITIQKEHPVSDADFSCI
jgi:tRNAThr (cytosine32-N3)-methyltransferase